MLRGCLYHRASVTARQYTVGLGERLEVCDGSGLGVLCPGVRECATGAFRAGFIWAVPGTIVGPCVGAESPRANVRGYWRPGGDFSMTGMERAVLLREC